MEKIELFLSVIEHRGFQELTEIEEEQLLDLLHTSVRKFLFEKGILFTLGKDDAVNQRVSDELRAFGIERMWTRMIKPNKRLRK